MDRKLLKTLSMGAQTVFDNAARLYDEAVTLTSVGALSRALFLHQISMEECAKVEVLGASAMCVLLEQPINLHRIAETFRHHSRKNKTNAYFLKPSGNEKRAWAGGRAGAARASFRVMQDKFHERSNSDKNGALYVDIRDGKFYAPRERITPKMVARLHRLNGRFLNLAANNVELLKKLELAPAKYRKLADVLTTRIREAADRSPKNLRTAIETLVQELATTEASGSSQGG